MSLSKFFIKKHIISSLQYLFNVNIVFNTVFYLKLSFKLNIKPKICTYFQKRGENLPKNSGNHEYLNAHVYFLLVVEINLIALY